MSNANVHRPSRRYAAGVRPAVAGTARPLWLIPALVLGLTLSGLPVAADGGERAAVVQGAIQETVNPQAGAAPASGTHLMNRYAFGDQYALGVTEFGLNHRSTVTGWEVARTFGGQWYFGQKDGDGSGLSLVWQKSTDQVSISTDGIRFTRVF